LTQHASGTFEVQITPQPPEDTIGDPSIGQLAIVKQFSGDLDGTSSGQMLATNTPVEGSAGYVAIERVTGRLADRQGSFALQHSGTMTRGAPQLVITVVPDSATDELVGLAGTMTIQISDGIHRYELDYSLPDGS
jgi:hypothetical protein